MAKVSGSIVGFYILFLFNLTICNSSQIENFDSNAVDPYSINLRQKRQTGTSSSTEYRQVQADTNTTRTTPKNLPKFYPTNDNKTSDMIKQEPPGLTDIDGSMTSPSPSIINANSNNATEVTTLQPVIMKDTKLLGVNGTGQRKIYPTSTPQPIVSEPINLTPKSTKISSLKKINTLQQEENEPNRNKDIPEAGQSDELLETIDESDLDTNKTILNHNITTFSEDYHIFYNSSLFVDPELIKEYWDSFQNIPVNDVLSRSHRRAMTVKLSFDFPFYGHPVRSMTVATGGFLYTGEYVHSWLAATQYIAPLMANFDTSLSNNSLVRFSDNGTAFTVIWENVSLQDKQDVGKFTFSTTLHKTGDIVFTYFSVPIQIESIHDDKHPVKVGLSDAYIMDKVVFFTRRKTIYEYHRVNFAGEDIQNGTIIYLNALPTCLGLKDCESCLTENPNFKCSWCPTLNKCSTGTDRKRQDWIIKGCDRTQITDTTVCPAIGEKGNNAAQESTEDPTDSNILNHGWPGSDATETSSMQMKNNDNTVIRTFDKSKMESSKKGEETSNVGLVLGFMLPICLIMSALVWVLYAYRNPHTKSGQLLIQYRPSQWTWRRGEARYTAATIHM